MGIIPSPGSGLHGDLLLHHFLDSDSGTTLSFHERVHGKRVARFLE